MLHSIKCELDGGNQSMNILSCLAAGLVLKEPSESETLTNAQLQKQYYKRQADRAAEMELLMEKETDELKKRKLRSRLDQGIYEWDDLYN